MSELVIYGVPASTFVRTVRMTCVEKSVPYRLVAAKPGQPSEGERHPFGRIPFARHGDLRMAESGAIARYIDRVFPGPRLQPSDPAVAIRVDQWISTVCDYLFQTVVRGIILPRPVYPGIGRPVDEAAVEAAVQQFATQLPVIEEALAGSRWLAGDDVTLADLFLAPIVAYVENLPEGAVLAPFAQFARWRQAMAQRPSFLATPVAPA